MKAFVAESGSVDVVHALGQARVTATCVLSSVECRVTFLRMAEDRRLTQTQRERADQEFRDRWQDLFVVAIDEVIADRAVGLAQSHHLRSADAVHLAAALAFSEGVREPVGFLCWDGRLWRAAQAEGFRMVPATEP